MEKKVTLTDKIHSFASEPIQIMASISFGFLEGWMGDRYNNSLLYLGLSASILTHGYTESVSYSEGFKEVIGEDLVNELPRDRQKEALRGFVVGALKSVPLYGIGHLLGTSYKSLENIL